MMGDVDPIKMSELSLGELDAVSGGAESLTDVVKQMVLLSNTLKDMADAQRGIINKLP